MALSVVAISAIATFIAPTALAGPNCPMGYQCIYSADLTQRIALFQPDPDLRDNFYPDGSPVVGNVGLIVNASTINEAHYYDSPGYLEFLFCLNPVSSIQPPPSLMIESLRLRQHTAIHCVGNLTSTIGT